ncbi:LOW QUALITY PROTEIN: hypothetical protein BRADI_1g28836v3 [Brachypodium distachyon]|uniref:Uncharacterized protein n=1 Tax=Brachypodium distachyon TaxID=15368 RepID=A0A2K2DLS5_BRADI|nr:LOW QUALITY PROTEIN: hypothetical protein BRADI_1g28836v3 [Brachypodium distachyon]
MAPPLPPEFARRRPSPPATSPPPLTPPPPLWLQPPPFPLPRPASRAPRREPPQAEGVAAARARAAAGRPLVALPCHHGRPTALSPCRLLLLHGSHGSGGGVDHGELVRDEHRASRSSSSSPSRVPLLYPPRAVVPTPSSTSCSCAMVMAAVRPTNAAAEAPATSPAPALLRPTSLVPHTRQLHLPQCGRREQVTRASARDTWKKMHGRGRETSKEASHDKGNLFVTSLTNSTSCLTV